MNNPFLYHPHPLCKLAADDICFRITQDPQWQAAFGQGKMLGVLVYSRVPLKYIVAYSGVVDIEDPNHYFVPPVYDLQHPDDFYKRGEAEISALNREVATLAARPSSPAHATRISQLKVLRREKSLALQLEIFRHFNLLNPRGHYRNIVDIFSAARRSLPPGGTGECCAPRLLQYYFEHIGCDTSHLLLAEFWYGQSPRGEARVHKAFYPSCIEKCSPLLDYMLDGQYKDRNLPPSTPRLATDVPLSHERLGIEILYSDQHLVVVSKPSGLLSTPAKDLTQPNVESWLHARYPEVKGPMLAHRLDQGTSGLLIAARDAQTHKALQQSFEKRTKSKRYIALLVGSLPSDCGILNLPMCPNPDDRPRQIIDHHFGKEAITRYEVLRRHHWQDEQGQHAVTMVALYPLTGRTHQLRLHAASPEGLAHPILGDSLYLLPDHPLYSEMALPQGFPSDRLLLHAQQLTIAGHTFTAPCPF